MLVLIYFERFPVDKAVQFLLGSRQGGFVRGGFSNSELSVIFIIYAQLH